jgi:hypothetical protein
MAAPFDLILAHFLQVSLPKPLAKKLRQALNLAQAHDFR